MTFQFVAQLVAVPAGQPAGGLNCNAACGAMCVDHATGGTKRPTASDVRALCREPNGSPDTSGGTTLRQVDDAVNRGYGVDLDVSTPMAFEAMWARLTDPTLIASVSVWYGAFKGTPAYASRTGFVGNHQVVVRRLSASLAEMFDPLADGKRGVPLAPVKVTKALLRKAAGQLRKNTHFDVLGDGQAYVGFARAPKATPKPPKYSVAFEPGAFFEYGRQGDVLITRSAHRFRRATSAPCAAPERLPYPSVHSARRRVVRITAGVLKDSYVEPGRSHVALVESK